MANGQNITPQAPQAQPAAKPAKAKRDPKELELEVELRPVKPWPHPVVASDAIKEAVKLLMVHIQFDDWRDALLGIFWTLFTHFQPYLERLRQQPYLNITAADMAHGKSTLSDLLAELSRANLSNATGSLAGLRRTLDKYQPVVFLDQTEDTFSTKDEGAVFLKQMMNIGYTRNGKHLMCNENNQPIMVKFWSPFCLVGTGKLPQDTEDRCIKITMVPATRRLPDPGARRKPDLENWGRVRRSFASIAYELKENVDNWLHCIDLSGLTDLRGATNYMPLATIAAVIGWREGSPEMLNYLYEAIQRNAGSRAELRQQSPASKLAGWIAQNLDEIKSNPLAGDDHIQVPFLIDMLADDGDADWFDYRLPEENRRATGRLASLMKQNNTAAQANPLGKDEQRRNRPKVYYFAQLEKMQATAYPSP